MILTEWDSLDALGVAGVVALLVIAAAVLWWLAGRVDDR